MKGFLKLCLTIFLAILIKLSRKIIPNIILKAAIMMDALVSERSISLVVRSKLRFRSEISLSVLLS